MAFSCGVEDVDLLQKGFYNIDYRQGPSVVLFGNVKLPNLGKSPVCKSG